MRPPRKAKGLSSKSEGMVRARASKDRSVRFLGWLKMDELDPVIRGADLIPSLYEPRTKNAQIATPGKLLTAMSLSIPTLVPAGSFQAEIVKRFKCGLVVDWKNGADVREAIVLVMKTVLRRRVHRLKGGDELQYGVVHRVSHIGDGPGQDLL